MRLGQAWRTQRTTRRRRIDASQCGDRTAFLGDQQGRDAKAPALCRVRRGATSIRVAEADRRMTALTLRSECRVAPNLAIRRDERVSLRCVQLVGIATARFVRPFETAVPTARKSTRLNSSH